MEFFPSTMVTLAFCCETLPVCVLSLERRMNVPLGAQEAGFAVVAG